MDPASTLFCARLSNSSTPDSEQQTVLAAFDALGWELNSLHPARRRTLGRRLSGWTRNLGRQRRYGPRGIYLWGGVGRGKTLIMDAFADSLPASCNRRVHFHRFMLEIHGALRHRRDQRDPLAQIGRELAAKARVLCFDEFYVADIGDAMILSGLLQALLENQVTLVITSNTKPDDLYRNGLQRDRFLPAIELLNRYTRPLHMGGSRDYRLEALDQADVYHVPDNDVAQERLRQIFQRLAPGAQPHPSTITINDRPLATLAAADGVMWFNFDVLCADPRSKADYVELSRLCHTLLISGIPRLDAERDDAARRFVELVDEIYDRRVNVVASAADQPEALYSGERLARGFRRTASRLREFQSTGYIASAHRP